jgi:hypothetical protein
MGPYELLNDVKHFIEEIIPKRKWGKVDSDYRRTSELPLAILMDTTFLHKRLNLWEASKMDAMTRKLN